MKEDILEQLVDGYFSRQRGVFTKHNVKYKPDPIDIAKLEKREKSRYTVSSDIDVLVLHTKSRGYKRVSVISCKSWQQGFDIDRYYNHLIDKTKHKVRDGSGEIWKKFRELVEPKWAKAFRDTIFKETGSYDFTYYICITKIKKNKDKTKEKFKRSPIFLKNLTDRGKHTVKIEFLTLESMLKVIFDHSTGTTVESTEIGRFMQLIKAAELKLEGINNGADKKK